jgi:peptide deformylase
MAVLPIVTGKDEPLLRTKTEEVLSVTKEILRLLKDMEETVKDAQGVGLAAPQIGQKLRVCLAKITEGYTPLINPRITWKSEESERMTEGCLSLPGIEVDVRRPREIVLIYLDTKGKPQERKLSNLPARIVQHEIDHLDGVLIVDYVDI